LDITWYGKVCFRMRSQEGTVITDPYPATPSLRLPKLSARIVTFSQPVDGAPAAVELEPGGMRLSGPGEYEIGGIFVWGVPMQQRGQPPVTAFVFEMERTFICHLGLLAHMPSSQQIEELGTIDVLLLPVGGPGLLTPDDAADLAQQIEPKVIIPMYYGLPGSTGEEPASLDRLLRALGSKAPEPQPTFSPGKGSPAGPGAVVVLECRARMSEADLRAEARTPPVTR
jgi:L-ascorbate metabolism protein UlaG (beta-lactamase superfamily)